ncbi:hypothetical protein QR680_009161 [Steinernema hermaphroditum]|uniref:Uncharacterized protein n=1 Tax=Steinernema hermaphroditum TaxID=289476 RepID=A0AA39IJ91_9BILA|nr:hypothetical protein QR680_009161 [Steinernema hermaphroditum]
MQIVSEQIVSPAAMKSNRRLRSGFASSSSSSLWLLRFNDGIFCRDRDGLTSRFWEYECERRDALCSCSSSLSPKSLPRSRSTSPRPGPGSPLPRSPTVNTTSTPKEVSTVVLCVLCASGIVSWLL